MGAPCSCARISSRTTPLFANAIKCRSFAHIVTFTPGADTTELRKELVNYIATNEKDMNAKLLVLYQRAVNFPEECLKEFVVEKCQMKENDWPHLMRLIFSGRRATRLHLCEVQLSPSGFDIICRCLEVLNSLQSLTLSHSGLGFFPFQQFLKTLPGLPHLRKLDLAGNAICSQQVEGLMRKLCSLSELQSCALDENDIDDNGAYTIAAYLPELRTLEVLSLRLNQIMLMGEAALMAAKQEKLTILLLARKLELEQAEEPTERKPVISYGLNE